MNTYLITVRKDIQTCCESILQQYPIDHDCMLIGGFSGGAIAAIDVTMAGVIPVIGFISLCPALKPESFTDKNVEYAARRGIKGVFMEGEFEIPVQDEEEMIEVFKKVEFPYKYYINKGARHDVPEDFNEKTDQALKFILGA